MKGASDHWNATSDQTSTGRPVDAVITPAVVAAPFECGKMAYQGYTEFCNMHDYAAAVFPVTLVNAEVDVKELRDEFLGDWDRFTHGNFESWLDKADVKMTQGCRMGCLSDYNVSVEDTKNKLSFGQSMIQATAPIRVTWLTGGRMTEIIADALSRNGQLTSEKPLHVAE